MRSMWKESQLKEFNKRGQQVLGLSDRKPNTRTPRSPKTDRKPNTTDRKPNTYEIAGSSLPDQVDRFEVFLIRRALEKAKGNQTDAATELGISRASLVRRMKKHNMS